MEKRRKWQLFLILAVVGLTMYNIFPTLFYYLQPLKSPIEETQARKIADAIEQRVAGLEKNSKEWLHSFCSLLGIKPQSIRSEGPNLIAVFAKSEDAARFRKFLPRAGSLIPFVPAQLILPRQEEELKEVLVQRRLPIQLDAKYFSFASKNSPLYRELMLERAAQIAFILAGPSDQALSLASLNPNAVETLAFQINAIAEIESAQKSTANRYMRHFTQGPFPNRQAAIENLIHAFDQMRDRLKRAPESEKKEATLMSAESFLKKHTALFASGEDPILFDEAKHLLQNAGSVPIGHRNPLFAQLSIDWAQDRIVLALHPDVDPSYLQQFLMNEAAKISRIANEKISFDGQQYCVPLHTLSDVSSLLVLNLEEIGCDQTQGLLNLLREQWHPQHPDLQNLTIAEKSEYDALPAREQAIALVVHSPLHGHRGLTVVAKGFDRILKNYAEFPDSEPAQTFSADFKALANLLEQNGFQGYRSERDLYFAQDDYVSSLLTATREEFRVLGTRKYAVLELSDLEQRIKTENRIDTQIHEELLNWRDEYYAAQVSIEPHKRLEVPKPIKNVLLSNLVLSWTKYFRGDEARVIRWGLDLSGGKTVQLELRDPNHNLVQGPDEIRQGINELYNRVNKMGVSEVAIRQLGSNIVLDFPGAQSLSASELIKASSMYFHIVNEKFSSLSSPLAAAAQKFLQEVWNEAVVTDRKDAQSINAIARKRLEGESISETARILVDAGLRLQSSEQPPSTSIEDETAKIALIRGEQWFGQTHPLLFVFHNYTLEGSQLSSVQANYDPQKGNYLSFEVVHSSIDRNGQKANPRNTLQAWTSRYSKEKVAGTPLEEYSSGRGWRMAVILNDTVISAPTLDAVIRDSASISGSFSQREVNRLAADLKAGSLSFTPHILSEKNVSPELGLKERSQGIFATIAALLLVIGSMILYYRFAGVVASIAVLFNLLILWATLQNIGAALSLAGIAGIILTVGMAVDANVLVFERIKEEFAQTGRIASAISAGYQKAYSAIVDSNLTTILVALILLNFDAGPIKGFAITLIIGIVSSMFTALFMTRFYFAGWVQNPKHTALQMADWIHAKSIDFLKRGKLAFSIAAAIICIGGYLLYAQRATIFGMDFTGGYSLYLELEPKTDSDYMSSAEKALIDQGAAIQDFQIRELDRPNRLRILFGTGIEQPGKPFFGMPIETAHQTNPRIDWVLEALHAAELAPTPDSLAHIETNWTSMSGQMSDTMKNNALIGLLISLISIFIYISFRFEYKFAAAALVCLLHDVLITMGMIGLLHSFGVPVQIDLNTIAAIMTIIGYSLNDTIIIFDRIREEIHTRRKTALPSLVNDALNATLSRTTITSGTTLMVLIALVLFGGSSIFSFALVMAIGVFFGTLSSWYIASPAMLFFHGREEKEMAKTPS